MKTIIITVIIVISTFFLGWFAKDVIQNTLSNGSSNKPIKLSIPQNPLNKYSIENLSRSNIKPGTFQMSTKLDENDDFVSYLFHFSHNPSLNIKEIKTTTGQINLPLKINSTEKFPIIIMLRGYVNQETYKTGDGTRSASQFFARNGFITIAPDFLGYSNSDKEAENIFESRFQTYVTALSLIKSLNQIGSWDENNIFLWGHSNGGQIALTVLEITGQSIPTTLWAPVTKPFPYSILYYTDDSDDRGKLIRSELATFENSYDVNMFSLTNYLSLIDAEILLHQGTADDAVPKDWSDEFVAKLKSLGKSIIYFVYSETDHNMQPNWNLVIERDLEFFQNHIK